MIHSTKYPTQEQMARVERAARELEEAMRDCPGVEFQVEYGSAWRDLKSGSTCRILVYKAVTITATHVFPVIDK